MISSKNSHHSTILVTYGGRYHATFQPTNLFSQPCHRTELPLSSLGHTWLGSSCSAPKMHPSILQGSCVETASMVGLLLRGCHVIPPQAGMRAVSLPGAIPLYLFLLMSVLRHSWRSTFAFRHAQPSPTHPKTSRTYPSTQAHDLLGTAWFSGYRSHLGITAAHTKPPRCSLASPFSPHTRRYHGTSAPCHSAPAKPHFSMLTTRIPCPPEQNPPRSAWTKKIPSLLHFIPASSGTSRDSTHVGACMRALASFSTIS